VIATTSSFRDPRHIESTPYNTNTPQHISKEILALLVYKPPRDVLQQILRISTMTSLPPVASLPHSDDSTLKHMLDLLFEPSPPLHALTLPVLRSTTFPSYDVLIIAVNAQLSALASQDEAKLSEILCAHPRLGEKKVESEQSRKEQAQLQTGGEEEKEVSNQSLYICCYYM
jgi:hypothetical protein